jgi:hypothetical protein
MTIVLRYDAMECGWCESKYGSTIKNEERKSNQGAMQVWTRYEEEKYVRMYAGVEFQVRDIEGNS